MMIKQFLGYGRSMISTSQGVKDWFTCLQPLCLLQSRNVFILKRRWPPGLHKKGQRPRKLRGRNFVYDLVEDTNSKKKENMDLILTDYVAGLGEKGSKVSVKPAYAYNKLLLPGLAVYPTEENIAKYCDKEISKNVVQHSSPTAERTVNVLSRQILAVTMNKEVPWTLEPWHIRTSFRKAGFYVPEEAMEMPKEPIEGPNLDLEMKEFVITVTVNNLEKVQVRCRIHHWSTKLADRLPFVEDHWKLPAEPLFPQNN